MFVRDLFRMCEILECFVSGLRYPKYISFTLRCFKLLVILVHWLGCCYCFLCGIVCLPASISDLLSLRCFPYLLRIIPAPYHTTTMSPYLLGGYVQLSYPISPALLSMSSGSSPTTNPHILQWSYFIQHRPP